MNFTAIDNVKFILCQSQTHIYFRVLCKISYHILHGNACSCLYYNYKVESEVNMQSLEKSLYSTHYSLLVY